MRTTPPVTPSDDLETIEDVEVSPNPDVEEVGKSERPSRRSFVFFGALAAASLAPKTVQAQARSRRRPVEPTAAPDGTSVPLATNPAPFAEWDPAGVGRLVRRVTMGVTAEEMALAKQLGWNGYLNYQLNYTRINDDAVETTIATKYPLTTFASDQLGQAADQGQILTQLRESTLYRAAFSKRQLQQRMIEFWSDHFNQDIDKVQYLLVADQRDVIRKHALGKFPDMVRASAHSAAMMVYLDQNVSRGTSPNQNYARELMELHTVGVDGGYTQADVAELSRVLTGWTIQGRGNFVFNPAIHDVGTKTVMGMSIQGITGINGIQEGENVINMLVAHPSTARYIATKMLMWLLTPEPTETQITTVASVYKATGGDIKSMIRVILNESWLSAAPMKLKRPFHFVASALRSAKPTVNSLNQMVASLNALGHQLFAWDTPDGYPDKAEYWAGNIVPKWNFSSQLSLFNSATTLTIDTTPYRAGSPAAAVDLLDQNFFGGEMPLVTRNALLSYAGTATLTDARARELIALALSSNAFQWY
jgi:uncharacterized protein (DUF1800 family)